MARIVIDVPLAGTRIGLPGERTGDPDDPLRPPSIEELTTRFPVTQSNLRISTRTLTYDIEAGTCQIAIECEDASWLAQIEAAVRDLSISQRRSVLGQAALIDR